MTEFALSKTRALKKPNFMVTFNALVVATIFTLAYFYGHTIMPALGFSGAADAQVAMGIVLVSALVIVMPIVVLGELLFAGLVWKPMRKLLGRA